MMRKIFFVSLILLFIFSSLGLALGQWAPAGKWWRLPRVVERLNLSPEEQRKLDDLFSRNRRKLIRLKSRVEEERFALEELLEREQLDESAIMDQFRKLERARSKLAEERFMFLLGVRKIVGFERFEQLKGMYKRFQQRNRTRR